MLLILSFLKVKKASIISDTKNKIKGWSSIVLILLLASLFYLLYLGKESLWIDELYSLRDATVYFLDFPNNFSLNRPFYFIILHFWMKFSTSEAWLRGLSVIFALGSIFLIYKLGCRLYSKSTGLVAALLLTFSTLAINHAQQVRMYMVSICIGIASSLIFTYLLETPKKSYLISWLGLRFLAVLTIPINILLLATDLLLVFYQLRQRISLFKVLRKWFWVLGILFIPTVLTLVDVIPPLIDFINEQIKSEAYPSRPSLKSFVAGLTQFTASLNLRSEGFTVWYYEDFFYFYSAILGCLLVIALLRKRFSLQHWYSVLWGFLPLIAIFLLSQLAPSFWFRTRYLLLAAPYILLLFAEGFVRVFRWQRQVALLVILSYIMIVTPSLLNYYTAPNREDWRGAIEVINVNEQPKDVIVLFPDIYSMALEYYYEGSASIYFIEALSGNLATDKAYITQAFRELPSENFRFWLLLRLRQEQERQIFEDFIAKEYQVQRHEEFWDVDLYLVKSNI